MTRSERLEVIRKRIREPSPGDASWVDVGWLLDELETAQAKLRRIQKYTGHVACARNGLGGAQVDCTCGLFAALVEP